MPDHVHLVVSAESECADFQRFVRLAKQRSGYAFVRATGQRLWQESYFERVLRADERLAEVITYVINNPLRADLAVRLEDYPYWGSEVYSREELLEYVSRQSAGRV